MAASAYITLTARDAVTPTLKKIQGEMEAMARSVRRFGDNFTSFATLGFGTGTALGIYEVGKASIEAQIQLERLDKSFTAIYNSSSAARQQLEFVRQTSMELGQEFYSSAEAAKTFFAAGQGTSLSGQLNQIYTSFSKAGAALALSADDMQGIFLALGQSMSKGKVQAEELRGQIGERLPGAFQIAAKAMGVSTAELDKMMVDGKLLTDDLLPKMAQALDDRYGKAAESAADTVQAAINRMSTAWTEFKAGLLDSGPAVFTIKFVTEVLEGKNAAEAARKRKEQLDSELERIGAQKSVVGQTIIGGIGAAPEVQPVMGYTDAQRQALARQKAMDDAANRQLQQGLQQQEQMLTKGREAITKALKETTASRRAALVEEKADALKAIDEMVAVYRKQGTDVESLLKDREKVSKAYDDKIAAFDKRAGKDAAASARQAAVVQADYNGELERTRQTIDSLQQQLGLDKTEDLARAKIRIEQQYQATLSKTNEELTKQVAQGKLTQGQASALKAEKDKAAELQKQVALRDAEQKAQEKSVRLAEGQLKFFKELGELSGDYGQSLTLQNRLIEKQAKEYREVYKISDELVDKWVELQKLQVSQDPFDGAYRGLLKFSAEYADSGKQWEKISYSFAGNFQSATRDMFDNFLDTGRMSFASLERSFATLLKDMAYQALVQPVVLSIVGGVQQGVYGMTTAGRGGVGGAGGITGLVSGAAQQYGMSQVSSLLPEGGLSVNGIAASVFPSTFAPSAAEAAANAKVNALMAIKGPGMGTAPTTTFMQAFGPGLTGAGIGMLASPYVNNLLGIKNSYATNTGSMIGGLGSAAILGTLAAANIWNPGGWVLGGLAALGSLFGGGIGSLFGGGGDKDPWVNISSWVDLLGTIEQKDPYQARSYRTSGTGYEITANQGEGISWETGKQLADMAAGLSQEAIKSVATFRESVAAIGNDALEASFGQALEKNRFLKHWYEFEDREVKPEELMEDFQRAVQEKLYLSLTEVDLSTLATAADGAIADTIPEIAKAITDSVHFVALGANLGEYQDDFNAAISGKLLETLNQMDTSGIALDVDKSSLAGWEAAAKALQGWQEVTDALDEILEPTSELESSLQAATTQFDAWIDRLEDLGWQESAIAEIEAKRARYMNEYASALTRATEQDLYLRSLALQYGDDSLEYGLQSLQYRQQNELAELAKKFGKDSAIYNQAVETQQAELLAYQIQYWQSYQQQEISSQQQEISSQQQVVGALDKLVDALKDARADLWASDKNLMGTRYDEALAQFDATYQQAMSGDQEALAQLSTLASSLLALGKDNLATSQEYNDLFYGVDRKLKLAQGQAVKQVNADQAQLNVLNAMLGQGGEQQLTLEEISAKLSELKERYQQELADITGGGSLSQREALIQAKVDQLNAIAQGGRTDWTAESFLAYMYGEGLTFQSWYDKFGKNENLGVGYNSEAAYRAILENKAAMMNAGLTLAPGQEAGGWTADKVLDQIHQNGMTVDEWYLRFGRAEGFASGGITPVGKPFWVGENGPELMMSPRQYGVLSNPDSMALMDRPVMGSRGIITAIRDSSQSIYSVLRQLLTKTDAMYGQQRRILQRLDMWDAEGLPN